MVAPAWAELSIQPNTAFAGWVDTVSESHASARKGSLPCCLAPLLPPIPLWFISPKQPFFLFWGEGAWPVFSYPALHMAIQILGYTQDIRQGAVFKCGRSFFGGYNPFWQQNWIMSD